MAVLLPCMHAADVSRAIRPSGGASGGRFRATAPVLPG